MGEYPLSGYQVKPAELLRRKRATIASPALDSRRTQRIFVIARLVSSKQAAPHVP
jgi:hypothetical protein